jgi:F-type H+-transporting ATPase subunit delta
MAKKANIQELARRYTTAVFELAKSSGALDSVAGDLDKVVQTLAVDEKLRKKLNSPLLTAEKQVELVREVAKALKLGSVTTNFLLIVARNRRVKYLDEIINAFQTKIAEEKGELKAIVTSAEKLSDEQVKQLESELSKKTGKAVQIQEHVEPDIIGGLIVKIGSKMVDYSVRSRLNKLKNQMKAAS